MALKIENPVETAIGAAVLAAAIGFGVYAGQSTGGSAADGYAQYTAQFLNATGVAPGTEVRVAGVRVGSVEEVALDTTRYRAVVTLNVDSSVRLSDEASVAIDAEGLLGGSFLDLDPGPGENEIESGDRIRYAQGSVSLLRIISSLAGSTGEQ